MSNSKITNLNVAKLMERKRELGRRGGSGKPKGMPASLVNSDYSPGGEDDHMRASMPRDMGFDNANNVTGSGTGPEL